MPIPTKGMSQIRTLSGRVSQLSLPYRRYMQVTCLEMEKARRSVERKSASQRISMIDARLEQIEAAKRDLLKDIADSSPAPLENQPGAATPAVRRSTGGFKIRY